MRSQEDFPLKFAFCNEAFEGWSFPDVCSTLAGLGYKGIEIAPFTLAPLITDVSADTRRELKQQAADAGIEILGLHWLLAKTEGFHLNSPEPEIRKKTAEYFIALTHACADLGGTLMVLGSPTARKIAPGVTRSQAYEYAADCLRRVTPTLTERSVDLCLEPLSPVETDFMQTADEGLELMKLIDHPRVKLHLDVKAMASESTPMPTIIKRHVPHTGHFHANDVNLRGPGMGDTDFVPIFGALQDASYDKWISVEVFDFKPGAETLARESIDYMRRIWDQVWDQVRDQVQKEKT